MRLLALDPGLAACGFAELEVGDFSMGVLDAGALLTSKETGTMTTRLEELASDLRPLIARADLVVAESPAWPRNARGAAMLALAFGLIRGLAAEHRFIAVPAQRWRKQLGLATRGGDDQDAASRARKADVASLMRRRMPDTAEKLSRLKKQDQEHAFDALAIGCAWWAMTSDQGDVNAGA